MQFEWDPVKAELNLAKHGVSFDEAKSVFGDPMARMFYDYEHSFEEERNGIFGRTGSDRLILVIFTDRFDDRIRIISAREMTPSERKKYENANG